MKTVHFVMMELEFGDGSKAVFPYRACVDRETADIAARNIGAELAQMTGVPAAGECIGKLGIVGFRLNIGKMEVHEAALVALS